MIWGYGSLYEYCVYGLKLSEGQASAFISVSRKAVDIPELTEAIKESRLSVSKIKRMAVVLTPKNAKEWIEKAQNLSTRDLETEVERILPPKHSFDYRERLSKTMMRINMALTTETLEKLESAKDLLGAANYEAVLAELLTFYLERKDPVQKAARVLAKMRSPADEIVDTAKESTSSTQQATLSFTNSATPLLHSARNVEPDANRFKLRQRRKALTAHLQHLVNLRDHGKCQHKLSNGKLCGSRRYIHLHHIREVAKGGKNAVNNLISLCSSHHRLVHRMSNETTDLQKPTK